MQTKLTLALRPCSQIKMAMTTVAPTIATRTTTEQFQLKIIHCDDPMAESRDHRDLESKIAVDMTTKHLQAKDARLDADSMKDILKDIGVAFNPKHYSYVITVTEDMAETVTSQYDGKFTIAAKSGAKYTLEFTSMQISSKAGKKQVNTVFTALMKIPSEAKEANIVGDNDEYYRAKIQEVVAEQARKCNLKLIRCARPYHLGRPIPCKIYLDFDLMPGAYLTSELPWENLLLLTMPDTGRVLEIKFKETIDAQSGQKSNPIEALGVCMECGKSTRVYCVCPKKNKGKRKAGRSDADELAALMDA